MFTVMASNEATMTKDEIAEAIQQAIAERWSGQRLADLIDQLAASLKKPK